jgi:hypothetical protein
MFQFLVSGAGWEPDHDSLDRTRVFEHTDATLVARFKPKDVLDTSALLEVPALFASEGTNSSTPLARVGRMTKIRPANRVYEFDYTLDPDVPGIPNATLSALSTDLSIDSWEFSRTHWAIKDVDLFHVLLKKDAVPKIRPKLFKLSDEPVDTDAVAVMMPFAAEFAPVYKALRQAAKSVRMTCTRADDIWNNDVIIQDVVALISTARVVVCDLTGKNANVFYEAGIAHTLGKDVILIAQHESDIPFDLRHIRHHYCPVKRAQPRRFASTGAG